VKFFKDFILTLLLSSIVCFNQSYSSCGEYEVRAKVISVKGFNYLMINPGTQSEIKLEATFQEIPKLVPYIGRFIEAKIKIEKEMDATKGEIALVTAIREVVPNLIANGSWTSMKLTKTLNCKK
jgi:hypothetical protein